MHSATWNITYKSLCWKPLLVIGNSGLQLFEITFTSHTHTQTVALAHSAFAYFHQRAQMFDCIQWTYYSHFNPRYYCKEMTAVFFLSALAMNLIFLKSPIDFSRSWGLEIEQYWSHSSHTIRFITLRFFLIYGYKLLAVVAPFTEVRT